MDRRLPPVLAGLLATGACGRLGFDAADGLADAPAGDARARDAPVVDDARGDAGDGGAAGPTPIHQYDLDNSFADDFGGLPLFSLGGALGAEGYRFGVDQGLTLPAGLPATTYTIDVTFSFDTLGSWRKIVDFKALGTDEGLYAFDDSLQFVIASTLTFATSPPVLAAHRLTRVTLSRTAAGVVVGAVDGVQQITFQDDAGVASPDSSTATFVTDDGATSGREASAGLVRRIRIYDRAYDAATLGP